MIGTMLFAGFLFVGLVACAICGHLGRLADAIEAQNRHYGIGVVTPAEKKEAA